MNDMWSEDWESKCHGCGSCCFEKLENDRGTIFYTQTPCRYLDVVTRQCRIYENRFSINPECVKLTAALVETLRWLPSDCGYKTTIQTTENEVPRRPDSRRSRGRGKRH